MELRQYAAIIWRWLWLIALGTAVAAASGYVVSRRSVPVYQANTMLLLSQSKAAVMDTSTMPNADRLAATYAELLRRPPVLEEVIKRLDLNLTTATLSQAVRVQPLRNTQLIVLSVEDTNPARAAAIANEIPRVFIQQNEELQTRRFADSQASLQSQLESTQTEIARIQESIAQLQSAALPDQAELDRQQRDLSQLQVSYSTLFKSYEDLRLEQAKQLDTLLVTDEADPPSRPIRPRTGQNTALAAILGAALALGAVFLIEYLDDALKSPDDVQQQLGLTTLSAVPVMTAGEGDGELAGIISAQSPAAEAFRVLRTNLQFAAAGGRLSTIVVTSPAPGEGKSFTAGNLSAALAQSGKRVVLIDGDLHRPRLHRLLKVRNNVGISTALLEDEPTAEGFLQETAVPGLQVLTSGPLPPNPAELLGSEHMRKLLSRLHEGFDTVVIDSPPTLALADAAVLSTLADGVVLVLDAGKTRREVARRAVESLDRVNARLLGVVLNRMTVRDGGYYYYGHYYGSEGHEEEHDQARQAKDGDLKSRLKRLRNIPSRRTV